MIEYLGTVKKIKGFVQVGASYGQELNLLKNFSDNIILVEPLIYLQDILKSKCPTCLILPFGLGSENKKVDFYLANNGGESSSILKPKNHTIFYPDIKFSEKMEIEMRTFESLIGDYNINLEKYNVLITDTQGFDLEVLRGFGKYLNNFELIICEYINSEIYENNSTLEQITNYLFYFNFELIDTFDEYLGAGNSVYMNKNYQKNTI